MVDDSVKATVATVISGIVLCELLDLGAWTSAANSSAWTWALDFTSSAWTWAYSAANWCLFLLPTAYAVVTVLNPGFGLIDYSVYCSLDRALVSRVAGGELSPRSAARGTGLLAIRGSCRRPRVLVHPRSAAICGAVAFAYDLYFHKTDAPELCFAGDLCRASSICRTVPLAGIHGHPRHCRCHPRDPVLDYRSPYSRRELLRLIPLRAV